MYIHMYIMMFKDAHTVPGVSVLYTYIVLIIIVLTCTCTYIYHDVQGCSYCTWCVSLGFGGGGGREDARNSSHGESDGDQGQHVVLVEMELRKNGEAVS